VTSGDPSDRNDGRVFHGLSHRVEKRFFDDDSPHLDRFGPLLLLSVVAIVALSLIDLDAIDSAAARGIASTILSATIGITLVLGLRASGVARRWRRAADLLVALAVVTSIIVLVVEQFTDADANAWQSDRPSPLWVAVAVITPVAVVRRLVMHRRVSASTMAGAIAAYLLVAIAYSYVYLYIDGVTDHTFFVQTDQDSSTDFMYFSLVTVTTVGYGDLSPADDLPRLLATSEAVLGQVYLVTFVAMLVGLLIQQRDS
jgi:hypothetical protein